MAPDAQPKTVKLAPAALLALPRRLCNPPPSVGKVRSCTATAVVDVKLDDVLERKHLPPLGLKDFEEWLLFVEQNAENLYFILWLKEYSARYTHWINNARALLKQDSPHPYQSATNHSLAVFYSRAKQTFFTPNSPYELDLPSDILGPFHTPSLSSDSVNRPPDRDFSASSGALSPHPDPAVFSEVEDKVRSMLQESLDRFANSTITNVGTARATCGLIGGTVIALAGFLPPIAENFALSRDRWLRVLALPGVWLGLTIVIASLRGVCMMIYVFGDLRQLRSFELARPAISSPQRLRPLRDNPPPLRLPPPEPEPWSVPIRRPPIIPRPPHDPDRFPVSSTNPTRFTAPLSLTSPSLPSSPLRNDPRVTLSSLCAESCTSCSSDASRTSTSSDQVEIHISEAFQDIEPPYIEEYVSASPIPSSWRGESPSHTPMPWMSHQMGHSIDSVLCSSPVSQKFSLPVDNTLRSNTMDREEGKWFPTANFILPFEYQWDQWDEESNGYTTDGSLGGYGGGDEESRISHFVHSRRFPQDGPRARVPTQLRVGPRRGTVSSSKGPDQLETFDFDGLPAFQPTTPAPGLQRKPRYRACDASVPPPIVDEASLTDATRRGGLFRTWFVEVPKVFIRRTQGRCAAAKGVVRDVLSRSANEARSGGGDVGPGPYLDMPETGDGQHRFLVAGELHQDRALDGLAVSAVPNSHRTASKAKEKGRLDPNRARQGWRVRWRRMLSVPAFRSPLTKIWSPVVTRAQWEIVVRSGFLSFVISAITIAVLVAVPVPP